MLHRAFAGQSSFLDVLDAFGLSHAVNQTSGEQPSFRFCKELQGIFSADAAVFGLRPKGMVNVAADPPLEDSGRVRAEVSLVVCLGADHAALPTHPSPSQT